MQEPRPATVRAAPLRAAQLRITQFGSFEVWRGSSPVPGGAWPQRKTKALLKLLLAERGRVYAQDQLVELLFPELEADKAVKSLYNRISELRRVLEPDLARGNRSRFIVRVGQGSYCFDREAPCWLDTEVFAAELQAAQRFRRERRWAEAVHHYERALGLYGGEYLAEDRYEEWTLEVRERWRAAYEQALLELAGCHGELRQPVRAMAFCQRAIESRPGDERAYRLKMQCALAAGDRQTALETYQACVRALDEHLEAAPDEETQRLYAQIHRAPPPPPEASRPARALPRRPPRARSQRVRPQRAGVLALALPLLVLLSAAGWWGFSQRAPVADYSPSVAVLPFVSISADHQLGFWFPLDDFSDGATMELAQALSQVPGLRVASTTSTFALKGRSGSVVQFGEALNVDAVVEGSVRRAGNRLRIAVQLINVADGLHLWAGQYDSEVYSDSFRVLDPIIPEIVASIAQALGTYLNTPPVTQRDEEWIERIKQVFNR